VTVTGVRRPARSRTGAGRRAVNLARRWGTVYGMAATHPLTGVVVAAAYVGKTVQRLADREDQHRVVQPWADTIVGHAYVIDQGWWTSAELAAREVFHIRRLRPLYNIEHNMGNRDRVKPWDAVAQRQQREPGWVPVEDVARLGLRLLARRRFAFRFRRVRVSWWLVLWLTFVVGLGAFAVRSGGVSAQDGLIVGVGGASLIVGLLYVRRPKRRRRRSRRALW
jgi:hypothetical protein